MSKMEEAVELKPGWASLGKGQYVETGAYRRPGGKAWMNINSNGKADYFATDGTVKLLGQKSTAQHFNAGMNQKFEPPLDIPEMDKAIDSGHWEQTEKPQPVADGFPTTHPWDPTPHILLYELPVEDVRLGDMLMLAYQVVGLASAEQKGWPAIRLDLENLVTNTGGAEPTARLVIPRGHKLDEVKRYKI